MKNDLVAIVTPIGNEKNSICEMYEALQKVHWHLWITVIDSFCQDGSDAILQNLARQDKRIVILQIGKGTGVAHAYIEGIQQALKLGATKMIEVDVGHPIDLIPKFVESLNQVPLVVGTRVNGGAFINVPFRRKLLSKLGTAMAHMVLQLPFSDCTSGLQGFTRQVAEMIPFNQFQSTGHFYQTEFKFYCRFLPFIEIPFGYMGTQSSIKTSAIKESLYILFRLSKRPNYNVQLEDYTPISNDRTELLRSIQDDLQRLAGNESQIISYHLRHILHRIFIRTIQLIEQEMEEK